MPTNPIPDLVAQAQADLSAKLGVAASSITLDRVEEREWPDSSLGCPEPGMMYSQVITPGWLIVLSVNGKTYEYHAGSGHVVTCQS